MFQVRNYDKNWVHTVDDKHWIPQGYIKKVPEFRSMEDIDDYMSDFQNYVSINPLDYINFSISKQNSIV